MNNWLAVLITALLSAGGATFIGSLVKGIRSLRGGARAREREAINDLARWREEADDARREAEQDRDFWRRIAGSYAYQMRMAGLIPIPSEPVPPSERINLPAS